MTRVELAALPADRSPLAPGARPMTADEAEGAAVEVATCGRLHLGFLDPSATLGRPFGSLGVVVDGFRTRLTLALAERDELRADGPAAAAELDRVAEHLARLRQRTGRTAALSLRLHEVLPAHAGFGSGTQLALAVGRAFVACHGLAVDTPQVAAWLGRGRRSGIGIAGFDQGGLIVDGGPGRQGQPAAVLARLPLPRAWRVLLVLDDRLRGLAGDDERRAIATLPGFPRDAAADVCHQVLMRVLPGAAGADFEPFAAGITEVQRRLGQHFAPAQAAGAYTSAPVGRLVEWLGLHSGAGIGQSSWGPTGFAFFPSEVAARRALEAARAAGVVDPALTLQVVAPHSRGASVVTRPAPLPI